jgi:hypothetical protein
LEEDGIGLETLSNVNKMNRECMRNKIICNRILINALFGIRDWMVRRGVSEK